MPINGQSLAKWLLGICLGACLYACGAADKDNKGKLLASVGNVKLYAADLRGIVPAGISRADSAELVARYIDNWIRRQVMVAKASQEAKIDEADLTRRLEDYRADLLTYAYESQFVAKNLDTTIKESEIDNYYRQNAANFELKQNIVKATLVQIPANSPDKEAFKRYLNMPTLRDSLRALAQKSAIQAQLNDSTWIDFEQLTRGTPFRQISNQTDFIQSNAFAEATENQFTYLLRIREFKLSQQPSPLPFVRNRVRNMILNERKVQLRKNLEKAIYEEAKKKAVFQVFK